MEKLSSVTAGVASIRLWEKSASSPNPYIKSTSYAPPAACNAKHTIEQRLCRWLLMMHDRAERTSLSYTHEFLAHMLGTDRKSVTLAAQAMQMAGLIDYHWGTIQIVDRPGLEKTSCECYYIVQERFDAFLRPPPSAVQGNTQGRIKPH